MERDVSGGDQRRTFHSTPAMETEACQLGTFNSTELRAVDLRLELVPPVGGAPLGVVVRARRAAAVAGTHARRRLPGVNQAVHEVVSPRMRELWEISAADENVILSHCW